jgi:hypothetical protein
MKLIIGALALNAVALLLCGIQFLAVPTVPDLESRIDRENDVTRLRKTAKLLLKGGQGTARGLRLSLISFSVLSAGSIGLTVTYLIQNAGANTRSRTSGGTP